MPKPLSERRRRFMALMHPEVKLPKPKKPKKKVKK